jgi:hypothetical protein
MRKNMYRRTFVMLVSLFPWLTACANATNASNDDHFRRVGIVVEDELSHGAAIKEGIQAVSDTGKELFGHARLNSKNGAINTYGDASIPRWVRVTWREGTTPGQYWTTGTVVGDYAVQVLSRIPQEAFELIKAGKKRLLVLRFRIRDNGVDFGWMVRLQDGVPFETLMKGGDF